MGVSLGGQQGISPEGQWMGSARKPKWVARVGSQGV